MQEEKQSQSQPQTQTQTESPKPQVTQQDAGGLPPAETNRGGAKKSADSGDLKKLVE